jgi:hypothetical protein
MNFLKADEKFTSAEEYKAYLNTFLSEGDKFNGVNLWLGNLLSENTFFAHNQDENLPHFSVLEPGISLIYGNGHCSETWFKQHLG